MMKAKSLKAKKSEAKVSLPTANSESEAQALRTKREQLQDVLRAKGYLQKPTKDEPYPSGYIEDVYKNTVVFGTYDDLYACTYTKNGDSYTLSAKVPVERKTIYVKK